jgi:hypothetical protein
MSSEEFEIFLNADQEDDSLTDIVCVPSSSKLTTAQRRWRLIKSMARAQYQIKHLTSLTENEQSLLDNLASQETAPKLCKTRQSIRSSIYSKAGNLTETEANFLHRLVEAPHITTEQLEKTQAVLLQDPLFARIVEEEKHDIAREERRIPSQQDASFRSRVWEYCGDSSTKSKSSFSYHFQGMPDVDLELSSAVVFSVLGTSMNNAMDLSQEQALPPPHVLSPPIMDALRPHLPYVVQHDNFWLKFSSQQDGMSLRSLLHKSRGSARTIVAIETMDGNVLGSFTSSPWREQGQQYYGSGEAFLWRLEQPVHGGSTTTKSVQDQAKLEGEVAFFEWSGENRNVQRLVNANSDLIIGGGGPDNDEDDVAVEDDSLFGSGLVLAPDLTRGHTHSCLTFGSPALIHGEEFEIANIEVWTLTPVDTLEQAEKVELSRHFVFDQGNFALA